MKNKSDAELLHAYQTLGDHDSLATLFMRYAAQVLGICLRYLEQSADAEDAGAGDADAAPHCARRLAGRRCGGGRRPQAPATVALKLPAGRTCYVAASLTRRW